MQLIKNNKAIKIYYFELLMMVFTVVLFILILPLLRNQFPQLPFSSDKILSITGSLLSDAKPLKNGKFLYTIKIDTATSVKKITASAKGAVKIISRGNYLYKGSFVEVIEPFFEEEYNYSKKLFFNPLPLINGKKVILLKESEESYFRNKIALYVFKAIEKIDAGDGLVSALLTGNRIDLDPILADKIRKSGCSYVLALSGMHLGIVTMFVLFLFNKIAGKKRAIIAAFLFNFLFAFFAGMSAPLLRSFVFFALINFAKIAGRSVHLGKLFVLSFIITVLISPDEAGELSFHYSFAAMAGIIYFCPYLYRVFMRFIPPFLAAQFALTISAQLSTFILTAAVFGEIYFSGIIASVFMSLLVTLFMLIAFPGMIIVIISDIPSVPIAFLIKIVSFLIRTIADFFSRFPVYKTDSVTIFVLIILNIFVIVLTMFPHLKKENKIVNYYKRFK